MFQNIYKLFKICFRKSQLYVFYVFSAMTWFDSFREEGWNTYYPANRSAAKYDPDEVLIVFFGAVLGLVVLVIFIGSKGPEVRGKEMRQG